jgi:two-component system cell cycle response regulator
LSPQILIIEDNDMSFVLAEYLLRQKGYTCIRAADGPTGLRLATDNTADLILCDLDLPEMDGYEIARTLRADASWRVVPLLAFTASSAGDPQAEVLAAGFVGYIAKPVDPRTFTATIASYLASTAHAS